MLQVTDPQAEAILHAQRAADTLLEFAVGSVADAKLRGMRELRGIFA